MIDSGIRQTTPNYLEASERTPLFTKGCEGSHKLGDITKAICDVKQANVDTCLNSTKKRYFGSCFIDGDLGLIFGDIGNVLFSGLLIAQTCMPSLAASALFLWTSCILGSLGGVLNIGVGIYCLKLASQAHTDLSAQGKEYIEKNGVVLSFLRSLKGDADAPEDVQKYYRLVWDGLFMIGIGALMVAVSLSVKIAALGALGAFLTANPWVLPLLWFLITVPLLLEVIRVNKNIWNECDLAGAMQLDALKKATKEDKISDFLTNQNNPLCKRPREAEDPIAYENSIMHELETNIGVEAAIEAMRLRSLLLNAAPIAEIETQLELLETKIAEWNKAQKWRLAQQVLLITSFAFSMIGLSPQVSQKAMSVATNGVILLGNLLPLAMDIAWPFKRNCYMVVPEADKDAVMEKISGIARESIAPKAA